MSIKIRLEDRMKLNFFVINESTEITQKQFVQCCAQYEGQN